MQRAGEFGAKGEPLTPRAKQKQKRSHERADATLKKADDLHTKHYKAGKGPEFTQSGHRSPSKHAAETIDVGSPEHFTSADTLRVPKPLKARKKTHKKAASVSLRGQHLEPERDRTPQTDRSDAGHRAYRARPESEKEAEREEEEKRDAPNAEIFKNEPHAGGREEWEWRVRQRAKDRRAAARKRARKPK